MPQGPTPQRPSTRLVLAISLDGRLAPAEGGAAKLGGDGDRRALEEALAWADACLIGAGTLRAHQCTCLIRDLDLLKARQVADRSDQPDAVVVSRRADFPLSWSFFQQPLQRVLLSPQPAQVGFDNWVEQGGSWSLSLQRLQQQGYTRLLVLGGAELATSLLAADAIDELQLTLTPRVLGGEHSWVSFGSQMGSCLPPQLADVGAWQLIKSSCLGGDELLLRYRRRRLGEC